MDLVTVRRAGRALHLELSGAATRNALDRDMAEALLGRVREANADSGCDVLVFRSALRSGFSVGPDLEGLRSCVGTPEGQEALGEVVAVLNQIVLAIDRSPKITVAAFHGYAFGGGLNVFLACDYRIAVEGTVFVESFLHMGVTPDLSASWFLPRLIGRARTLELLLTGRLFGAGEARSWGLLHETVPRRSDLGPRLEALAVSFLAADVTRIARTRRLLAAAETSSLEEQLARERLDLLRCFADPGVEARLDEIASRGHLERTGS